MSGDRIQHVQIRQPATANLMVDSADRTSGSADSFTIQKKNSILNGFFHRIATTEVVLDWNVPNIQTKYGSNTFIVAVSGGGTAAIVLPEGFYTVAQILDALVVALNATPGIGAVFSILPGPPVVLHSTVAFTVTQTTLSNMLGIEDAVAAVNFVVIKPDLRIYKYIDFLSSQLTYNQKLKDAATSPTDNNVLCRWYFAWGQTPVLDTYGFPILQGYSQFVERRLFNPPKQIRWENNMPVGQLAFQLVGPDGQLIGRETDVVFLDWLMTLQISED
jgi:hypothetical protein